MTRSLKQFCLFIFVVLLFASSAHAQSGVKRGRVVNNTGRSVASARVVAVYADGKVVEVRTDDQGEFTLDSTGMLPVHLQVFAPGYTIGQAEITEAVKQDIFITLHPLRLADSVTVTASRTQLPNSRSIQSVVLLRREEQEASAAQTVDDYLRKVPGFTLFRRSSSLVAHPTSQGVSLRGIGPSGASRSLVLADGIPLGDPFGGWVYWGRLPRASIDHVEILRGGASELYGTDALGGVIQLFRRSPTPKTLRLEGYLGSFQSSDYSFFASHRLGRQAFALTGEFFRSEGYIQVSPADRGNVDIAARSKHRALEALWEYRLNSDNRIYAVASQFTEHRGNGTPMQTNDTQIRSLAGGASFITGGKNQWTLQSFALAETFDALFSAVALDRKTEALTRGQRVPSQNVGVQGLWRRRLLSKHLLLAGADYTIVKGASDELIFSRGFSTGSSRIDGRQDRSGIYFQDLFQPTLRLQLVFGIRWDTWRNHNAYSFDKTFSTGAVRQALFPSRTHSAWSPKLGARLDLSHDISVRGSLSRSFRAPTLNELYRSFRVGNIVTNANPELRPERATAGEIGLDWGLRSPLAVRSTIFWYEVHGNVANVTLTSTPSLITRQRQNLGDTRSRGFEWDAVYHPNQSWTLAAGYFLSDATVRSAPLSPDLVGVRIPQVPRHQAVFEVSYRKAENFHASLLLRVSGSQFDDDQNRFPLGSYQVIDFSVGKPLSHLAELFFACENLFDRTYAVGRTPVETVGMPRRVHGGIRFHLE